jgi:N-methylhydantoinase B
MNRRALEDRPARNVVELAVMSNRMESVVRSMVNTILRTGRSGALNTGRDCSCCILTRDSELLAMAESAPIHVMAGPDIMTRTMHAFHPVLRRGDAFLHNSPYHGNSHAADHSILVPVIDDDRVHHFTVFAKAHQPDCGNSQPTTYFAAAKDVYEEGAPIFPCVKVQEQYTDCEDIIRMCKVRIRVPDQWWGDYLALLGGARVGEMKLLELGAEVGWDAVHGYVREWMDYSERRMVTAISKLPRGHVSASGWHDPFPGVPDGVPLHAAVDVNPEAGKVTIDLRDNPDCLPCGLNLTEATATTAAIVGVLNSIGDAVPANGGSARCLEILLRENCCVGIPRHPASCAVATTNMADRVTNLVQRAMANLGDGIGMAEAGSMLPPGGAVISGEDPRRGDAPFINQIFLGMTGGPATPAADGWLTYISTGGAGVTFRDSVELDELRFPILVEAQRIIRDSEGAGRFRGAPSAYVEYGPLYGDLDIMYNSDATVYPARGVRGGLSGAKAQQYRRSVSGEMHELMSCGKVTLSAGERVISMSSAGAGYGSPAERDPDAVRLDVIEGWISRERAESVYRVALTPEGAIDVEGTAAARGQTATDSPSYPDPAISS